MRSIVFSKKVVFILVLLLIVFVAMVFIPSLIVIASKEAILKKETDNSIINSDYVGWKTVIIDETKQFKIPKDWNFISKNNEIYIMNEEESLIAKGAILRAPFGRNEVEEIYNNIVSIPTKNYESFDLTPTNNLSSSAFYEITFYENDEEKEAYYEICFFLPEAEAILLFKKTDENVIDKTLIEAISFSYHSVK